MDYQIRKISASETTILRQLILRPHQQIHQCVYPHDDTPETFHLGAYIKERQIGIASFLFDSHPQLPEPDSQYRIRGMATLSEFRNLGIGKAMLQEGISILKHKHAKRVWCNARESAFGFYEQKGFKTLGEMFDLPGIGPHKVLWRNV